MRDPVFYRWHAFIDDIFQEFKATLPTYPESNVSSISNSSTSSPFYIDFTLEYNIFNLHFGSQLNYQGVTVTGVQLQPEGGSNNEVNTFWQQSDVDLSRGMDFQERGSVFVRFTHLQHQPFTYNITVNNEGAARQGTCRIFIAPKVDERGNPWLFRDQRLLFIEMDKFTVNRE